MAFSMTKFQSFVEALAEGAHNLGSDTLKIALSDDAPSAAADLLLADLTSEIANYANITNNATAREFTASASAQSGGTYKLTAADIVLTAEGTVGPFRYVIIYNDTAGSDELIGFYDYTSSITLEDTETLTIDFDDSNGVLTIA